MLYRCCFHHFVDNSIFYKKYIQPFYIGPILFHKIKSYGRWNSRQSNFIWCQECETENLFGAKWQLWKILFGSQRVKYKTLNTGQPSYWRHICTQTARSAVCIRNCQIAQIIGTLQLYMPQIFTNIGQQAFHQSALKVWNTLSRQL